MIQSRDSQSHSSCWVLAVSQKSKCARLPYMVLLHMQAIYFLIRILIESIVYLCSWALDFELVAVECIIAGRRWNHTPWSFWIAAERIIAALCWKNEKKYSKYFWKNNIFDDFPFHLECKLQSTHCKLQSVHCTFRFYWLQTAISSLHFLCKFMIFIAVCIQKAIVIAVCNQVNYVHCSLQSNLL